MFGLRCAASCAKLYFAFVFLFVSTNEIGLKLCRGCVLLLFFFVFPHAKSGTTNNQEIRSSKVSY